MKKNNIIKFLESIKDIDEIAEIYIENGIRRDYIDVRYYDKNKQFKNKSAIFIREE